MKSVRNGVFETNSSSVHSLSIKRNKTGRYDYNIPMDNRGKVELIFGRDYDFGWGAAAYNDAYAKLNYLACMSFECFSALLAKNNRTGLMNYEDVYKIKDIQKLSKVLKKNIKGFTGFSMKSSCFDRYISERWKGILYLCDSIDHQSWEDYGCIDDFLNRYKISLENFLFNPKVTLIIMGDG